MVLNFEYKIMSNHEYHICLNENITIIFKVEDQGKNIYICRNSDNKVINIREFVRYEEAAKYYKEELRNILYHYLTEGYFMLNYLNQNKLIYTLINIINDLNIANIDISKYEVKKKVEGFEGVCYTKNNDTELWYECNFRSLRFIYKDYKYFVLDAGPSNIEIYEVKYPIFKFTKEVEYFNEMDNDILINYDYREVTIILDYDRFVTINKDCENVDMIYKEGKEIILNITEEDIHNYSNISDFLLEGIKQIMKEENIGIDEDNPNLFVDGLNMLINNMLNKEYDYKLLGRRIHSWCGEFSKRQMESDEWIITHKDMIGGYFICRPNKFEIGKNSIYYYRYKENDGYISKIVATEDSIMSTGLYQYNNDYNIGYDWRKENDDGDKLITRIA